MEGYLTVEDMIRKLERVEDKNKPIRVWIQDSGVEILIPVTSVQDNPELVALFTND